MEQQIRFCTTSDGVRIAYATAGEGPPLVYVCGWPQHLELEWEVPFSRGFLETLAEDFTLIRYDMRGSGLSDRQVPDFSLESLTADLEAVVNRLQLDRFPLLSLGTLAGPTAIRYAAEHPERVSQMILCGAFLRGEKITSAERQRVLVDYAGTFGFPISDFSDEPLLPREEEVVVRKTQRAAASPETEAALLKTLFSVNVEGWADRVSAPTLVMHARRDPTIPFALGREVAARLPQATFAPYEATSAAVWRQSDVIIPQIKRFLNVEGAAATKARSVDVAAVHTILFTDVAGSTALTERLGDAKAQEIRRAHDSIVREALKAGGGNETKHTGDGIMASFHSAARAVESAVAMQRAFAEWNTSLSAHPEPVEGRAESQPPAHGSTGSRQSLPTGGQGGQAPRAGGGVGAHGRAPLHVRIGLNAGEPVAEEADLFGTAVNLAKRICDQAEPGQILVSDVVQQLAAGKGFSFADKGEVGLKGFERPVRLYEVRWHREGQA